MRVRIVVVGASLGGWKALERVLSELPAGYSLPLAIVLHRNRSQAGPLDAQLQEHCALPVREAEDKDPIQAGHVFLAPADYHLLVDGDHFALSLDPPVCFARPSIDVLFESAAAAMGPGVLGALLTGSNEDGAKGLARIKACGGMALVEDPASAECGIMPAAALAATAVDGVLPIAELAARLARLGRGEGEGPWTAS